MKIDSDLVKKLRLEKNWTQEQLGDACGLSLRTIQRLENSSKASVESVRVLAAVFNVDPTELILIEKDETITPFEAIKTCFSKFVNFSDTATRFEYWWFLLFALLLATVAAIIHDNLFQIVSVILLLPLIAVGTRRLNDIGQSGWWQLLFLVPFGFVAVFVMLALESKVNVSNPGVKIFDVT